MLHGTMKINSKGHLEIGGCDTVTLAKKFSTPLYVCLLYTSPSPRDRQKSRMPSSA